MNYIRLNPQYIIRNEKCCSYIVKLEQQVDNDVQGNSGNIFVVPPVVGFIISEIGKNTTTISLQKISLSLGIDIAKIEYFVNNLIGKNESRFTYKYQTFVIPLIYWFIVCCQTNVNITLSRDIVHLTNSLTSVLQCLSMLALW